MLREKGWVGDVGRREVHDSSSVRALAVRDQRTSKSIANASWKSARVECVRGMDKEGGRRFPSLIHYASTAPSSKVTRKLGMRHSPVQFNVTEARGSSHAKEKKKDLVSSKDKPQACTDTPISRSASDFSLQVEKMALEMAQELAKLDVVVQPLEWFAIPWRHE